MNKTIINAISEKPSSLRDIYVGEMDNQELILAAISGNTLVFKYTTEGMQAHNFGIVCQMMLKIARILF